MQLAIILSIFLIKICEFAAASENDINGYLAYCDNKPIGFKIADPTDCTGYFLCHKDTSLLQHYCPSGTKFSEPVQACITGKCPPCDCSNCETTCPSPPPPCPSPPPPCPSPPPPCPSPSPPTPDCQFVPNGTLFPHSEHCQLFWQCVNLEAVLRFCEFGLWYDRIRYVCNYPPLVDCPANLD